MVKSYKILNKEIFDGCRILCPFYFTREVLIIENNNRSPRNNKYGDDLVNNLIRFPTVLVIGPDGKQLGEMPRARALQLAETYSMDLLCVAPNAKVPVCKILNYGKYKFQQQKKAREAKKNQTIIEVKEVQLSPVIGEHDLQTKLKHALRFLDDGNKVKITMRFRGRQLSHMEVGQEVIDRFVSLCGDKAIVEKPAVLDKRTLIVILASKVKK